MRQTGGRDGAGYAETCTAHRRPLAVQRRRIARLAPVAVIATLGLLLAGSALAAEGEVAKEPKPVNTAAPTLTGTPKLGQTLTCSTGTWSNSPTAYTYVWLRDGAPIAGQTGSTYIVQSADQGHSISCQVTAGNSGGEYTIVGLPSGSYNVEFFAREGANYLFQYYNGRVTEKEANQVSVTAPNTTSEIDAVLAVGGQITGKVTATGGAPLANVYVCAYATENRGCGFTNAGGEYTISGLPTGLYEVEFFPEFELFSGEGRNYLPQLDEGVSVTAGGTTPGVDAVLPPGGQITGTVSGAEGDEGIEVCAYAEPSGDLAGCTLTNASGVYTISSLTSGKYKVGFFRAYQGQNYQPQYYQDKASLEEGEEVVVTAGGSPTTGVDAAMSVGGQITGKVTAASGGAALADIDVCAYGAAGGEYGGCTFTNAGGEYTISGLTSGKYKVGFFASEGLNYLSQYYEDKASFAAGKEVVVTAGGSPATGVDAAMSVGGQITGKVTAASGGAALAHVEVCAEEATSHYETCSSTDAGGEYTISGLSTGTYAVAFYTFPEEGANYLPQYYNGQSSAAAAGAVEVTAGSMQSGIDAALIPGGVITGKVTAAAGGAALANVEVCAERVGGGGGGCADTNGGGGTAGATSSALKVAAGEITLTKTTFNAKTDELDFFFQIAEPGTLRWSLVFKNADIGFAASLGRLADVAQSSVLGAPAGAEVALAEAAKKKAKKGKKCGKGEIKHKGKCVPMLVPFASGSQSVATGAVEIEVDPDAKARKALEAGRTLHVSGSFTFQSTLGGSPITKSVSAVAHGHKKKHHGKKKKKH